MNKHFAYLTQHDDAEFFQKVAEDQAMALRPIASQGLMKTAMAGLLEGVTFEKIASRLDRDIGILKTAGPCGMSMGMQKRAGAYIDQLLEQCELTEDEFGHIFDKVAAEAILGDLRAAREYLADGLDDSYLPLLDREMSKIGRELTEHAIMEKEAGLVDGLFRGVSGLMRGGKATAAAGKAVMGAAGRGIARGIGGAAGATGRALRMGTGAAAGVIGGGAKALGRSIANDARSVGRAAAGAGKAVAKPFTLESRLARGRTNLAKTEQAIAKFKAKGPGSGIVGAARKGAIGSLERGAEKARGKVDLLSNRQLANEAKGVSAAGLPTAAERAKLKATAPAAAKAGAADAAQAAASAAKVKTPKAAKADAPKADVAAPPSAAPAAAAGEAADSGLNAVNSKATFKGSWDKFRDSGWKSLSSAEKQKLIQAGAVAVVGGRVVTGHGIVTGGQGII